MGRFGALAALAGLAMLGGCGGEEQGAGGVTAEEAKQLNEAAQMLDASPDSLTAGEDAMLGNGEQPSPEAGDVAVADNSAGNMSTTNAQ